MVVGGIRSVNEYIPREIIFEEADRRRINPAFVFCIYVVLVTNSNGVQIFF